MNPHRRQFLRRAVDMVFFGAFASGGGGALWAVLRFVIPPRPPPPGPQIVRQTSGVPVTVPSIAVDSAVEFEYGGQPAVLVREAQGEFRAFVAVCTHLNCTVSYDAASRELRCPCHAAAFGLDGEVLSGPPPRPLHPLEVTLSAWAGFEILVVEDLGGRLL